MKKRLLFLLVFIATITTNAQIPDANGILYVNKHGFGVGNSWESPIGEFADALKAAKNNSNIKQIWVAVGIYSPKYNASDLTENGDAKDYTFSLVSNVKIYGGFDPFFGRKKLNQRVDYQSTILHGNSHKNRHVLVAVNINNSVLDGFEIFGGYASGSGSSRINGESVYKEHGGAMNVDRAKVEVRNCTFSNNHADSRGGAIYATGSANSKITLINSIMYNNTSGSHGSAISVNSNAIVEIRNCTISNNISNNGSYGGAVDKEGPGNQRIYIYNSIIYNNYKGGSVSTGNLVNLTGGNDSNFPDIRNVIYNGPLNYTNTTQVESVDPNFVNEAQRNFRLKAGSPAIDRGNNEHWTFQISDDDDYGTDAYGFYRYINTKIDIGASEYSAITPYSRSILYVKKGGSGNRTGSSWDNAIAELADAVKWANQNHKVPDNTLSSDFAYNFYLYPLQIWVSKGTYKPMYTPEDNKNYSSTPQDNRDKSFLMTDNVSLYGSFEGNEGGVNQRNLSINNMGTILSGDLAGNDVIDPNIKEGNAYTNISDNAYHVVVLTKFQKNSSLKKSEISSLDGFQIKGGNADGEGFIYSNKNRVDRNFGGGLISSSTDDGNPTYFPISLTNMDISNNSSSENGGGIYSSTTPESIVLTNSRIRYNSAKNGGGFYSNQNSNRINRSAINHNFASSNGGGIYINSGSEMSFTNSSVNNNSAIKGVAIYAPSTNLNFKNSSIAGNKGSSFLYHTKNLTIHNSVVSGNTTNATDGINNTIEGNPSKDFQYSLVQDETNTNNGNILGSTDPLFNNLAEGDLSLKVNSPIVNKGNNDLYKGILTTDKDLNGNPRLYGDVIDIGAFELQHQATLSSEDLSYKTIRFYPNPVEDILHIVGAKDAEIINVYNSLGQKIVSQKFQPQISLGNLSSGLYILNIINKNGLSMTLKIIKK